VPDVVTNGEVFYAVIWYHVPVPTELHTERIEFEWSSRCARFSEKTEIEKAYFAGGHGGSAMSAVAPTEFCIEGPVEVEAKVRGAELNCKANAMMTVVNP
jgi:hypothetical protein